MNWKKSICLITLVSLIVVAMTGCGKSGESTPAATQSLTAGQSSSASEQTTRPEGWADETHGNNVEPKYEVVFPQDKVNQIKITIAPDDWEAMQANMTELFGAKGTGQPGGGPAGGGIPRMGDLPPGAGDFPQRGGAFPGAAAPPGGLPRIKSENPMWVPATIEFKGLNWTNVGVRYKGNSSLRSGWNSGTLKLPLKLDFDEFEDEYPGIENQRFYGFKQLSLSNAFGDSTYMHDAIAADLLAEAGLVAAETAYYEVIMDYGEGPVNLGLYVMIEVIDDTVIDRLFGSDLGNIYEGDGSGVSLAPGTFDRIEKSFLKENNEQEADWSDIEELYNVLHSEERTSDPEAWRESLESVFDVGVFLEWLAISAIIQNWDTYGSMSHNFYLYHDPVTDLLNWISWDHNEVLGVVGGMGKIGAKRGNVSLDKEEVGENWPLIRHLLDDPLYHDRYIDYIEETVDGVFDPEKMEEKCQELAKLIAPYAVRESGKVAFESAVQGLINRIYERFESAATFLAAGS
jgi:spore coat protein H